MSINFYPEPDKSLLENSAFGELRVIEPIPKIQVQFPYNINSRIVTDRSGGGGSLTHASGMAILSTGASANASGVFETVNVLKYNTGQGGLVRFTAIFSSGVANNTQIIGLGDELDGFFFGFNGTTFSILRRRDGVDNWIPQSSWNINTLPELNPGLGNVYQIQYQWLGFGQMTFFIEDKNTGGFTPVHRIQYANTNLAPSILNPTLPIMAMTHNVSNTTDVVLKTPSLAAFSEGPDVVLPIVNASGLLYNLSGAEVPVFSIRNDLIYQGRKNRVRIELQRLYAANDTTGNVRITIVKNATLTNANFNPFNSNSVASMDFSASAATGGIDLGVVYMASTSSNNAEFSGQNIILNPGETLTILAIRRGGAAGNLDTGIIWGERF